MLVKKLVLSVLIVFLVFCQWHAAAAQSYEELTNIEKAKYLLILKAERDSLHSELQELGIFFLRSGDTYM